MERFDLASNPAYQLWLATNAWQRLLRKALEPLGITHVQFVVLAAIGWLGQEQGAVSQAQVCRWAAIDPNMTSEVVKSLEAKNLIERKPHPSDRRAMALALTSAGEELLVSSASVAKPVSQAFFEPVDDELSTLTRLLRQLAKSAGCRPCEDEL